MALVRRRALVLAALALSALVFAGCTINGGGSIYSAVGAKKATFGFTWQTDDSLTQSATQNAGQLAKGFWSDGYVKFRIASGGITFFGSSFPDCWSGTGEYVSQNRNYAGGGDLDIELCDRGEPGPTAGDFVDVDPTSGPYSWYENSGTIQNGNLKLNSQGN